MQTTFPFTLIDTTALVFGTVSHGHEYEVCIPNQSLVFTAEAWTLFLVYIDVATKQISLFNLFRFCVNWMLPPLCGLKYYS